MSKKIQQILHVTMAKISFKFTVIFLFIFVIYKSIYNNLSIDIINGHTNSNMAITFTDTFQTSKSDILVSTEPCDAGDKYQIRAPRNFNASKVGQCLHPLYHTIYYDDIANTLCAAINVLYEINATFVIVQGTLLSILRKQPVLPWDADADIYLLLEENTHVSHDDDEDADGYWNHFEFYDNLFGFSAMDELFAKVKNATDNYKSNAKNGKEKYQVRFDVNDAPTIFRFMKQEATNWGCTGYTDIYVIRVDQKTNMFTGGDAGEVADLPVLLEYVFPIRQYTSNWFPHWRQNTRDWDGETLIRNTIPIPGKPHKFSELAYPNHMSPDKEDSHLTCALI
eukprot:584359_1